MWGRRRKPKPGGFARARAWAEVQGQLRRVALPLATFVIAWAAATILLWRIAGVPDFVLGIFVMVPIVLVAWLLASDPDVARWTRGADAELWTHEDLEKALGSRYTVVSDVQLDKRNVDHVVVGPAGLFAVETKYRSKPWATRAGQGAQYNAARQVESVARELEQLLEAKAFPMKAQTLVVLWGGGTGNWVESRRIRWERDTCVVAGVGLRQWAETLDGDQLSEHQRRELAPAVQRLAEERWQQQVAKP